MSEWIFLTNRVLDAGIIDEFGINYGNGTGP